MTLDEAADELTATVNRLRDEGFSLREPGHMGRPVELIVQEGFTPTIRERSIWRGMDDVWRVGE